MFTEVVVDDPKDHKTDVNFQEISPDPNKRCYLCKFFISRGNQEGNGSGKVWGPVSRLSVCDNFQRR